MGVAHAGMGIAGGHVDRVVAPLVAAMEACGVPLDLFSTVFDALGPLRSEIVEHPDIARRGGWQRMRVAPELRRRRTVP